MRPETRPHILYFMLNATVTRFLMALACCLCAAPTLLAADGGTCLTAGQWARPATAIIRPVPAQAIVSQARDADFVLLGETHDNPDDHLWQLQTLAMLLGQNNDLVIGMEMFPRRAQPVLDRWIAGELSEAELLEQSDWNRVWQFDPELYLPIMRFARLNHVPLIALNVDRSLISDIGEQGWDSVPADRREGLTDPAPASQAYRESLRSSFQQHTKIGRAHV